MRRCGCEDGNVCTKTSVCSLNSAVEETTEHMQQIVDAAEQYVEMHEASVCCPITPRLRASNLKTLMDAVSEYKELKL